MNAPGGVTPAASRNLLIAYVTMAMAVVAGLYARFWNLDLAAIALDEFHSVRAVEYILEYGVPRFDSGGYYPRGVALNYLVAAISAVTGAEPLLVFRLLTAVTGSLGLYGAYLLGTTLFDRSVGIAATILLAVSLVEIDMARYARMYAPFHCLAIYYCVFFVQTLQDSTDARPVWKMLALAMTAVFVAEGAALLAVMTLLGLVLTEARVSRLQWALSIALVGLNLVTRAIPWRNLGQSDRYPAGFDPETAAANSAALGPFLLPSGGLAGVAAAVVAGALAMLVVRRIASGTHRSPGGALAGDLCFAATIASALCGMLLLSGCFVVAGLCMTPNVHRRYGGKAVFVAAAVVVIAALAWIAYGAVKTGLSGGAVAFAKKLFHDRFSYPPLIQSVAQPWMRALPNAGLILLAGSAALLGTSLINDYRAKATAAATTALQFLGVIVIILILVAVIDTPYRQIRYSQFLYAPVLVVAIGGLFEFARTLGATGLALGATKSLLVVAILAVSDDVSFAYLRDAGTYRTAYRLDPELHMLRSRTDYLGPADFLNGLPETAHVTSSIRQLAYHSDAVDAVAIPRNDARFLRGAVLGGTREIWTNLPLLSEIDAIITRFCQSGDEAIYVVYPGSRYAFHNDVEKFFIGLPGERVFESQDQRVEIKRVDRSKLAHTCSDLANRAAP